MKTLIELMKKTMPDLLEVHEDTSLEDIWFDQFCCELLARDLEEAYTILIPPQEVDAWQTVGDILSTIERYKH